MAASPGDPHSYNPQQRVVYLVVIFALFPLLIWTGLAMAPGFTAVFPASVTLLGGRQSVGLVPPDSGGLFGPGETLSYAAHRLFGRNALAREFSRDLISAKPFANSISAPTEAFARHQAAHFSTWKLDVSGLVDRPASLTLDHLRAMPARSQITEVCCEEGWSYIAVWTGTPLADVLNASGVRPTARYIVYYSSDPDWWESIDIDEAMHPQTLVANLRPAEIFSRTSRPSSRNLLLWD